MVNDIFAGILVSVVPVLSAFLVFPHFAIYYRNLIVDADRKYWLQTTVMVSPGGKRYG